MICRHLQHGLRILNALATDITLSAKPADHFVGLNIDRDRQNKMTYLPVKPYLHRQNSRRIRNARLLPPQHSR